MLVSREPRFVYSRGKQSPIGLYWNTPIFWFTNPRFVLLIRDFLFCPLLCIPTFVTSHWSLRYTFILHHPLDATLSWTHVWQITEASDYKVLNMDIFLTQMHRFILEGRLTPRNHVKHFFLMDGCTVLDYWISAAVHYHYKARKSQDFFYIIPNRNDLDGLRVSKSWGNFYFFGWTIPLKGKRHRFSMFQYVLPST